MVYVQAEKLEGELLPTCRTDNTEWEPQVKSQYLGGHTDRGKDRNMSARGESEPRTRDSQMGNEAKAQRYRLRNH